MPTKKKVPAVTNKTLTEPIGLDPDASLGTASDRAKGLAWLKDEEAKTVKVKKKPVKRGKKSSIKVKAQPKVKSKPIKVKRIDDTTVDPVDDPSIKLDPFTKKVTTKFVVKDGMVIVQPVFNPFDES